MFRTAHRTRARATIASGLVAGLAAAALVGISAPAHAANNEVVVDSNHVDTSDTRANGHNVFTEEGVRVYTDGNSDTGPNGSGGTWNTDKAAGYFDVHMPLADIGEPRMGAAANDSSTTPPGEQLVVDFDGDGSADGILVGEPSAYGNDWWANNSSEQFVKDAAPSHTGGSGSDNHGTLDQWRAAFPDAQVLQAGWSLGSGIKGDWTIYGFTLGASYYVFAPGSDPTTTVIYGHDVDTQYTRANGHNVFRSTSGVRVYTDGSTDTGPNGSGGTWNTDKAAGYFPVSIPLADVFSSGVNFANTSGGAVPGLQLVVDLDNDGTADATLVGEPLYPGMLWMPKTQLDGTPVSATFTKPRTTAARGAASYMAGIGTPAEWRAMYPHAKVLQAGWSLGSGAKGDGIITSLRVGQDVYTFTGKNRAPSAAAVTGSTVSGAPVTVTLAGTDPDGDTVSYSAGTSSAGAVSLSGDQLTFSPKASFAGKASLTYTVDDGNGGTASGTVTITVAKASVTLKTSWKKVARGYRVYVTVVSTGNPNGATVKLMSGSKVTATGTVKNGKVSLLAGKLSKGKHPFEVAFGGTASTTAASKTVTINAR